MEDGVASIRAGGGITLLSDPEEEYAEALVKAERMFAGLRAGALRGGRTMILVIDNYDSFVFNIARYVEELGHETQVDAQRPHRCRSAFAPPARPG